MTSVTDDFFAQPPSMVLLSPSQRDMVNLNEALMKSIKTSSVMSTSSLDIVADKTLSHKTKEAILIDNLKLLSMQRDMLVGRIEETRHELSLISQETLTLLTNTE